MRPRFSHAVLACALSMLLVGCGGEDVVVQISVETPAGETQLIEDQPVTFLPFDRDSIFTALAAEASEPEPEMPDDLQDTFDEVGDLRDEWRNAEQEWAQLRDSLESLSDSMEALDTRSREYREMYQAFDELEPQVQALNQQKNQAFAQFDSLQRTATQRVDSVQAVIRSWEDEAFRDYGEIVDSIMQARDAEIREDTTDAQGVARTSLPGGAWWVHTRYELPFEELYWNLRVDTLTVDTLRLSRENAEIRLTM